jgi:hypothetical protein
MSSVLSLSIPRATVDPRSSEYPVLVLQLFIISSSKALKSTSVQVGSIDDKVIQYNDWPNAQSVRFCHLLGPFDKLTYL